jgi:pantoate ligase/cytidylate kinase
VATIVLRLIDLAQPTSAYFGEKDAQQLAVIRRLVTDLAVPVSIRACPTIREPSGLAISSRNQYLNESEKDLAPLLYAALDRARLSFHRGDRDRHTLLCAVKDALLPFPAIRVQYIDLVHPDSLHPLERIEDRGLLAIAAFVGTSRLIDNIVLSDRQPIIAIDGPAGAGKSTVTRQVADRLGLLYLDTGAMYRAITWLAMESGIDLDDAPAIAELLSQATLDLIPRPLPEKPTVTINGRDVTDAIRTPAVTERVSQVSAQPIVRRLLVERQKAYGQKGGVIAEGRDIGTNVFPDAELKVFLTASVQERAKRRWQEFQSQGHAQITLAQLEREIAERDRLDSQRTVAPLQKALDAIEIDSDSLSIEAVIDKIVDLYRTQFLALSFPSQVDCT